MRVALTFDAEHPDRPTIPGVVDSILDTLEREAVHATFFLQGRWVEANPATAARVVSAGHLVGSHSFYHARMPLLSDEGFREDVAEAERVIREACGTDAKPWFRCPFGAGAKDPRTELLLADLGYRDVGWNVETEDWQIGRSPADLQADVVAKVGLHGDGAIVLFHTWPQATGQALPRIIAALRDSGSRFVDVGDIPGA